MLSNPVIICGGIALGIIVLLILVVIIFCVRSSKKEREELLTISNEIENGFDVQSVDESDSKIESVLSKMQEAIDMKDDSVSFEQEQEENAIISYQELLASLGAKSSIDIDSIDMYDDELDCQIEISDFNKEIIDAYQNESLNREIYNFQNDYSSEEMPIEVSNEEIPVMNFNYDNIETIDAPISSENLVESIDFESSNDSVYEAKHVVGNHKFRSSEFISPVYGIMKEEPIAKEDVEEIIFEEEF